MHPAAVGAVLPYSTVAQEQFDSFEHLFSVVPTCNRRRTYKDEKIGFSSDVPNLFGGINRLWEGNGNCD
jgi:hypothetical protein